MNGTDPAIDFENQVRNWFSWEDVTNYELCNYVISRLLHCNNKCVTELDSYRFKIGIAL